MANLLSLPNELLQHIASYLHCSSALSLVRVNRQLRNACNDRLVFHSIAKNSLEGPLLAEHDINLPRTEWPEGESILAGSSFNETVRVAYSVERCIQALLANDETWTLRISKRSNCHDISNWLPQMMLLHHPAAQFIKPWVLLEVHGKLQMRYAPLLHLTKSTHESDFLGVNFALVYAMLSQLHLELDHEELRKSFGVFFSMMLPTDMSIDLIPDFRTPGDEAATKMRRRVRQYESFAANFASDQAFAMLPSFLLELVTPSLSGAAPLALLPIPSKIPFSSFITTPLMFPDVGDDNTTTSHLFSNSNNHSTAQMCTADFLNGTWIGFYSDERDIGGRPTFDPPMRNINMVARPPSHEILLGTNRSPVTAVIDRKTRGVDAHGEFMLLGQVCADGSVHLAKCYIVNRSSWLWTGRMTPFGIVGVWGRQYVGSDDDIGGYFWIWKEEWSSMA